MLFHSSAQHARRVAGHRASSVILRMFERLHDLPWHQLSHAYGSAADAARWIPALASEDPSEREEAVYGFLLSSVCHQYSLYSATPHVIPFVVEVLADATAAARPIGAPPDDSVGEALLDFVWACTPGSRLAPPVHRAILAGRHVYARYVNAREPKAAKYAAALVQFCNGGPAAG